MENKVATRFLIVSDTHSVNFEAVEKCNGAFKPPFPKADVILHCGDLTSVGGIQELEQAVEIIGKLDAELKLVIAGNHDMTLDLNYCNCHDNFTEEEHKKALEVMTGPLARAAGITYLEEGIRTFTLGNGAKFTIYTTPYTPEFYDWGFSYLRHRDRFNTSQHTNEASTSIAVHPIPDHGTIDILMTHGPPRYILDEVVNEFVGCDNLLQAVGRCRPRLHCFGHIHEGHGARKIRWGEDTTVTGRAAIRGRTVQENRYPEADTFNVEYGKETFMVNAAIMDKRYNPTQKPWLLDLDLPHA